ncbi:flagellar filament capping protein FliD [Algiphilus sp.]|uniref:flagellar filament capping protein FliD n=2 Tax=Algiphilus sp. TaxID=1872431 RepID=UPI0025C2ABEA|nr:flagellar filament capping protein FliD [Algiphilus sp.]MCK5771361.1 flagellar filament capping protein FliD [Algiphilus sp.]
MPITFAGIGSGLDLESLVTQLVSAERAGPTARLDRVESRSRQESTAFDSLSTSIAALRSAATALAEQASQTPNKATYEDDAPFTVTASGSASPARFDVEVETLARAHKLRSAAFDAGSDVGTGTLTLGVGGDSFDVVIGAGGGTPAAIAEAINTAADNTGVRATVVNGAAGAQLILSAESTGAANTLSVTATGGDGGLDALRYTGDVGTDQLTEVAAAADASIRIDGVQITSAGNRFDEVIDGIAIDVARAEPGSTSAVTVARDDAPLADAVAAFVKAYNSSRDTVEQVTAFNADSGFAGALQGDAAARGVDNAMRDLLRVQGGEGAGTRVLSQLGIEGDAEGRLSFDRAAFDAAIADDTEGVAALLGSAGLGGRADSRLAGYLGDDGLFASRTEAIDRRLDRVADDREALDRRIEQIESRLRSQFAALDTLMAQLQQDSNFLAQQLGVTSG